MNIYYTSEQPKADTIAVEQYFIGTKTDSISFDALLYSFISKASNSFDSQYVTIRQIIIIQRKQPMISMLLDGLKP